MTRLLSLLQAHQSLRPLNNFQLQWKKFSQLQNRRLLTLRQNLRQQMQRQILPKKHRLRLPKSNNQPPPLK
jgi:hypothetical protein